MKKQLLTYGLYVLLAALTVACIPEAQAQRARKHRTGQLSADSLRARSAADSLALLDTVRTDTRLMAIDELEAPVDTARLATAAGTPAIPSPARKERKTWLPVPNRSVWLSLAIPGAGQIYNRKYWKLPIIYGGFVGCAYALTWNGNMYKDYSQAYQDIMSDNPNNDSYMDFLPAGYTQEMVMQRKSYYQELFRKRKDLYRRQRDMSIFAFIGVYLLSVIDAYVDAELSNFDITNDLGMRLEPTLFNDAVRHRPQAIGLQCSITF
ncbi:MAG: DUF5683 domain-containing protein [Bacteroidales bacterium]|nr:DUF5683 domain-containing protein [Bacteroidales bacterium]